MAAQITTLPSPPSRQDPSNFNDRADTFLGALPTFQSEANALSTEVNTRADNVQASANAVLAATNITKWVSGTTYAQGVVVWSPINGLGYRRITASGSGTTDPSSDSTNYRQVNGTGNVSTDVNGNIGLVSLKPALNGGIIWPNDPLGGGGDTASITLESAGGENMSMAFRLTNDETDKFHFYSSGNGTYNNNMLLNGNVVLNAANYIDYLQPFTRSTSVATTSGSAVDFTGIPSWVKRITLTMHSVSGVSASFFNILLGTASGVESSGYTVRYTSLNSAGVYSSGSPFDRFTTPSIPANNNHDVTITFMNHSGNAWLCQGSGSAGPYVLMLSGSKTLVGTLDRLRITPSSDNFNAGSINIFYE